MDSRIRLERRWSPRWFARSEEPTSFEQAQLLLILQGRHRCQRFELPAEGGLAELGDRRKLVDSYMFGVAIAQRMDRIDDAADAISSQRHLRDFTAVPQRPKLNVVSPPRNAHDMSKSTAGA